MPGPTLWQSSNTAALLSSSRVPVGLEDSRRQPTRLSADGGDDAALTRQSARRDKPERGRNGKVLTRKAICKEEAEV